MAWRRRSFSSWTCSIRSTSWALSSLGYPVDPETQAALMVGQGYVSPSVGCLDASGAGLAQFCRTEYGLSARHTYTASWDDVLDAVGAYPCLLGGGGWYHWTAVRGLDASGQLMLANPAPGWHSIGQTMSRVQFEQWGLGPWALVEIGYQEAQQVTQEEADALSAENEALARRVAELETQVGYLTGDVARALQETHASMVEAEDSEEFAEAAAAQQAAINTLARGG
jgi:hypothetical protein